MVKGRSVGSPRVLERHRESPGSIHHAIQGAVLQGHPRDRLVNGTGNGLPNNPLNHLVNELSDLQPLNRAMNGIRSGYVNGPGTACRVDGGGRPQDALIAPAADIRKRAYKGSKAIQWVIQHIH